MQVPPPPPSPYLLLPPHAHPLQPNAAGYTALHVAAAAAAAECVAELLQHGASVDCTDIFGNTPLHVIIAASDYADSVTRLLTARADPNHLNDDGNSPLHIAAMHDRAGCMQQLLQHAGDPSITNVYGLSPHDISVRM